MPHTKIQNGFEYIELQAGESTPTQCIVLLHGHGSNAEDFSESIIPHITDYPDTLFIIINGQFGIKDTPALKAYLKSSTKSKAKLEILGSQDAKDTDISDTDMKKVTDLAQQMEQKHLDNLLSARTCIDGFDIPKTALSMMFNRLSLLKELNRFIDNRLDEHDIEQDKLSIMGFSLGGAIALYTAFARKSECNAVVSHSGAYLGFGKLNSKPRTLHIMGKQDHMFHMDPDKDFKDEKGLGAKLKKAFYKALNFDFQHTKQRLEKRKIPTVSVAIEDMDHIATADTIKQSLAFALR